MSRLADEIKSKFKSEQHEALLNVLFTASWFRHLHHAALREDGISVPQFNILRILRGAKKELMSMHEVRDRMVDRSPNATRLTDGLIEKGLVERVRCDNDRRVVRLRITEVGLEKLIAIDSRVGPTLEAIQNRWTAEDAQEVNRCMDLLRYDRNAATTD